MRRIIPLDRSVIVAADVTEEKFPMLMDAIVGVPGIVGSGIYKKPTVQEMREAAIAVTSQLKLAA